MAKADFNDLVAFFRVAKERSFTRAASRMGVSQSALSQTIRNLEERLGMRLLTRTTRSVLPSEAGKRLLSTLEPRLKDIEMELEALTLQRDDPAGKIRITAGEHPALSVLLPALERLRARYPYIEVEIVVDHGLTDIVAEHFDAGVRLGGQVEKDMNSVKIGASMRMAVVGAASYFSTRSRPENPRDLMDHDCVNMRLPTYGGLFAWEFEKHDQKINVRVEGQFIFNTLSLRLNAALAGLGLVYLPEDQVIQHIAEGRLIRVLEDWCPSFPGYHLYYPRRRHLPPAFLALVDELRYSG